MESQVNINCGIYSITNLINNKKYYGSSSNIKNRWLRHKWELNNNKHNNTYLQRAWNKYGKDNFKFDIILEVPKQFLSYVEQCFIDTNFGYNISINTIAPRRGLKNTKQHNQKISISNKGKHSTSWGSHSEISKKKIGNSNKTKLLGRELSIDTKNKISKANIGRTVSKETREKIAKSNKGKHYHLKGIPRTQIIKNKISKANKGKVFSQEHKNKLSISHIGKKCSEDTKEKISRIHFKKGYYFDKKRNRYRVIIKKRCYGDFKTELEAKNKVEEILQNGKRN